VTFVIFGCIGVFLIATLVLLPAAQAGETTVKLKVTSYLIKLEVVPVPDVENHIVGVYERRGVAVKDDGETAVYLTRGTCDFTKGQGPFGGYTQLSFADGSTCIVKYQGTMMVAVGKKLPSYKGAGEYIKGTGRFEGIKGKITLSGRYITPVSKETKGDVYMESTGIYTLPEK
jgi:hypothetical protein